MKNSICVFDSGVGGLTVLRELKKRLPQKNFIYLGDTARVPWGNRGREVIKKFSLELTRFLTKRQIDYLVVACHTASTVALTEIKRETSVPVVGVMEPELKQNWEHDSRKVGLIGTAATVRLGNWRNVKAVACPLLVPLVEEGWINRLVTSMVLQEYLTPLKKEKVEKLVLACTHYPFLKELISRIMGKEVELINPGELATERLVRLIGQRSNGEGKTEWFFTDPNYRAIKVLLGDVKIKKVDVC